MYVVKFYLIRYIWNVSKYRSKKNSMISVTRVTKFNTLSPLLVIVTSCTSPGMLFTRLIVYEQMLNWNRIVHMTAVSILMKSM